MNKGSNLYKELNSEELDKIIYHHFGETNLYKANLVSGGLFNTTYHISFLNQTKEIILRVGPVNRQLLLPFENNLMSAEEFVYQLLNEKNIPCSQVLVCDISKELINRDYMVVDYIASSPLSEIELTDDMKEKINYQIGKYTAEMHKITSHKFGRVSEIISGNGYTSWSEYIISEITMLCTKLSKHSILEEEEVSLCKLAIHKFKDLLDEVQTPYLVHADLWSGNILIRHHEQNYEVAAIIDADRAIFGDINFEFASPWLINEPFLRGYGQIEDQNANIEIRKNIYRLAYSLMDAYVWSVEYNNQENCDSNKNNAIIILRELLK
ncbi:MAG: phosphotransferase [Herbinix sp.]|jgi:fructosamine-3-kinase|nr:phosphotransferase [Herbinix sp.]